MPRPKDATSSQEVQHADWDECARLQESNRSKQKEQKKQKEWSAAKERFEIAGPTFLKWQSFRGFRATKGLDEVLARLGQTGRFLMWAFLYTLVKLYGKK